MGRNRKANSIVNTSTSPVSNNGRDNPGIEYCVPECKHHGKDVKGIEMLRCCTCMRWLHFECVAEDPSTTIGLYNCNKCILILDKIENLEIRKTCGRDFY